MMSEITLPPSFLKDQLPQILFKHRGIMPVPWLLFVFIVPLYPEGIEWQWLLSGVLLMSLGELIRIWAVGYAGGVTRTRGEDLGEQLVTAGPYGHVRNPMYIGNVAIYSGVCLFFGAPFIALFAAIFFILQYIVIIQFEERLLLKKFGFIYIQFCLAVPQWVPQLNRTFPRSAHQFSLTAALKSEKRTLTSLVVVAVVFAVKLALGY